MVMARKVWGLCCVEAIVLSSVAAAGLLKEQLQSAKLMRRRDTSHISLASHSLRLHPHQQMFREQSTGTHTHTHTHTHTSICFCCWTQCLGTGA